MTPQELLVEFVGYDAYEARWRSLSSISRFVYRLRGYAPGGRKGAPALRRTSAVKALLARRRVKTGIGAAAFAGFIAVIVAANWAINKYHNAPVGFGLVAPAGVYFAGLAFTLRDILHRTLGRAAVIAAILAGAGVSYLVGSSNVIPGGVVTLALASGIAFLASEFADMAVYEPLSRKTFTGGVVASNIVGAAVDSALFLWLALGSLAFVEGQIVGKLWMTAAALPVVFGLRKVLRP